MRHWICPTIRLIGQFAEKKLKWGCGDKYVSTIKRLKKGEDILAFYAKKDMQFKGIFNVSEKGYYYDEAPNWPDKPIPHRIGIEPIIEASVPIETCFEDLLFITSRERGRGGWSDHFQFSIVSIREEDYTTSYTLMKKQKETQTRLIS